MLLTTHTHTHTSSVSYIDGKRSRVHALLPVFSAYEQKRGAGGAESSCPGTPMSPMQQQHYSPKAAAAGRPDAGYMNPTATSQPLPSNSFPINTR